MNISFKDGFQVEKDMLSPLLGKKIIKTFNHFNGKCLTDNISRERSQFDQFVEFYLSFYQHLNRNRN